MVEHRTAQDHERDNIQSAILTGEDTQDIRHQLWHHLGKTYESPHSWVRLLTEACHVESVSVNPPKTSALHVCDDDGEEIPLSLTLDPGVGLKALAAQRYDLHVVQFFENLKTLITDRSASRSENPPKFTIIDIGANIGLFSRQCIARMNESIHSIHAYEPSRKIFSYLKNNLSGISKVHVHNSGIGAVEERAKFYVDDCHPSSSSLVKDALPEEFYVIEEQNVDIKEASKESQKWLNENTKLFYKSDTQGYDITIAVNLGLSFFEKVAGAIIEIYPNLDEQQQNMGDFMSIFNSFEYCAIFENPEHRLTQQDFSELVKSGKGFDLLLWRERYIPDSHGER